MSALVLANVVVVALCTAVKGYLEATCDCSSEDDMDPLTLVYYRCAVSLRCISLWLMGGAAFDHPWYNLLFMVWYFSLTYTAT